MAKNQIRDGLRVFVVPTDILNVPDLDVYEQMVYIVLRSFCSPQNDTAFPKYATIAKLGRMSERKAEQCVKRLIEKGLITKETRFKVTNNRKITNDSNLYTLNHPSEVLNWAHDMHPGSARCAPGGANDMHPPGAQRAHEQNNITKPIEHIQQTTQIDPVVVVEIHNQFKKIGVKTTKSAVHNLLVLANGNVQWLERLIRYAALSSLGFGWVKTQIANGEDIEGVKTETSQTNQNSKYDVFYQYYQSETAK